MDGDKEAAPLVNSVFVDGVERLQLPLLNLDTLPSRSIGTASLHFPPQTHRTTARPASGLQQPVRSLSPIHHPPYISQQPRTKPTPPIRPPIKCHHKHDIPEPTSADHAGYNTRGRRPAAPAVKTNSSVLTRFFMVPRPRRTGPVYGSQRSEHSESRDPEWDPKEPPVPRQNRVSVWKRGKKEN